MNRRSFVGLFASLLALPKVLTGKAAPKRFATTGDLGTTPITIAEIQNQINGHAFQFKALPTRIILRVTPRRAGEADAIFWRIQPAAPISDTLQCAKFSITPALDHSLRGWALDSYMD